MQIIRLEIMQFFDDFFLVLTDLSQFRRYLCETRSQVTLNGRDAKNIAKKETYSCNSEKSRHQTLQVLPWAAKTAKAATASFNWNWFERLQTKTALIFV